MTGNYKMTYNVDLVFCIDATGSMRNLINTVKTNTLNFYDDIVKRMKLKSKVIEQIRVRVIAFRDYIADGDEAMLESDFFTLPEQTEDLRQCLEHIEADGGGDIPEDGLEALAYAIRSPWVTDGQKRRHVIVVWTDAPSHPIGYGRKAPGYPLEMPESYETLSKWWGDPQNSGYMDTRAKRLVMFAPQYEHESKETSVWVRIALEWDQAMLTTVAPDGGLNEVNYDTIIEMICNTI